MVFLETSPGCTPSSLSTFPHKIAAPSLQISSCAFLRPTPTAPCHFSVEDPGAGGSASDEVRQ